MFFSLFDKKITTNRRDLFSRAHPKALPLGQTMEDIILRQFTAGMLHRSTTGASTHLIIMDRVSSIIRDRIMLITAITAATITIKIGGIPLLADS